MTHVVLTGSSGFVGSHVLRHLLAHTDWTFGCPVTFRHSGLAPRLEQQLRDHPETRGRVRFVRQDLAAPMDRYTADNLGLLRAQYVLHLASESHVDRSITQPRTFVENNVAVTLTMLEAVRTFGLNLRAFFQFSTDEVYGPVPAGTDSREWDAAVPSNPYSASKACQEAIAISYWRTFGVPLVITNTMNVVGEMQDPEKFVPLAMAKILRGERVQLHASAEGVPGSRHYIHARNAADALLFLVQATAHDLRESETMDHGEKHWESLRWAPGVDRPLRFNIVGEREIDNLELARFVASVVDKPLNFEMIDFHGSRPGHDLRYSLDGSRMKALGWEAPVGFEQSLEQTIRWTLTHPQWLTKA